jgi:hypothetical protein
MRSAAPNCLVVLAADRLAVLLRAIAPVARRHVVR